VYLVLEYDRVIGFCVMAYDHKDTKSIQSFTGQALYIEASAVAPWCQGQRIGTGLLHHVIDDNSKVQNFESLVREGNARRLHMLRRVAQAKGLTIAEQVDQDSEQHGEQGRLVSILLKKQ
jgi:ribosomal protein S18 acetylase RimI-like enzyme